MNHSYRSFPRVARLLSRVRSEVQQYRMSVGMALLGLSVIASPVFAASGDISGSTTEFVTLGATILKVVVILAGMAFVGLIIWGGLTLATNRPRGLAMVAGGLVGALLAGLSFVLVNTLTGGTLTSSMLLIPGALATCFS